MADARDVGINLLAALLGAIVFELWRRARLTYLFRTSRAFWKPLLREPSHVFVAEWLSKEMLTYDMAGFTGLGEVYALTQMMSHFSDAHLSTNLSLTTGSQTSPTVNSGNLIVLGGPDVNTAALRFKNANVSNLVIQRDSADENIVFDRSTSVEYKPSAEVVEVSGSEVRVIRDYGIIVRARNPLNADRDILVIAGAYGYGVVAGMQVCIDSTVFLQRFMQQHPGGFECIVNYSMTDRPPGISKIELIRPLPTMK